MMQRSTVSTHDSCSLVFDIRDYGGRGGVLPFNGVGKLLSAPHKGFDLFALLSIQECLKLCQLNIPECSSTFSLWEAMKSLEGHDLTGYLC